MEHILAENIRNYRKGLGLTQEQLAERLGITLGTVSKWERGSSEPDLSYIMDLAELFHVSVDALIGFSMRGMDADEEANRIEELSKRLANGEPGIRSIAEEYENAMRKFPNHFRIVCGAAMVYRQIGVVYRREPELQKALELYRHAIDLLSQNKDPRINEVLLRNEIAGRDADLASKDREIADLARQLRDCRNEKRPVVVQKQTTATNLLPTVIFKQGKSNVEPAQMAQIELIAIYMRNHPNARVEIKGYASPEGDPELNQRLSEARANSVRDVLVNRYGISSSRLSTVGCGPTSTLFEQVEFNRVATFNDNTK